MTGTGGVRKRSCKHGDPACEECLTKRAYARQWYDKNRLGSRKLSRAIKTLPWGTYLPNGPW